MCLSTFSSSYDLRSRFMEYLLSRNWVATYQVIIFTSAGVKMQEKQLYINPQNGNTQSHSKLCSADLLNKYKYFSKGKTGTPIHFRKSQNGPVCKIVGWAPFLKKREMQQGVVVVYFCVEYWLIRDCTAYRMIWCRTGNVSHRMRRCCIGNVQCRFQNEVVWNTEQYSTA